MTDDHDWVARLLAASGSATMPADVADRLERALQAEADGTGGAVDPAAATPAPTAGPTNGQLGAVPSGRRAGASAGPGPASPAPPVRPAVHGSAAATPPVVAPPVTALGTSGAGAPAQIPTVGSGPAAVVPPPATAGTTGAVPRLRSLPADGDEPATGPVAAQPEASAPGGATGASTTSLLSTPRRPAGSSRRELREEDQGERRRRSLVRWAPVAAGVLVLAGAAGVVGTQLGGGEDESLSDQAASSGAGGAEEFAGPPRTLLATGTEYSTAEADRETFEAQVRDLVALAASDPGADAEAGVAQDDSGEADASEQAAPATEASGSAEASAAADNLAAGSPFAARAAAEDSPLAEPQALAECLEQVTAGTSSTAAAVDLAVVDGLESTVIVVPDAAGLTYQVYVVGAGCGDIDTRLRFFTVTP